MITGVSNSATTGYNTTNATTTGGLSISDFYELLAAQMKYQDADNPMDTSEMMAMMVETQMIEAITQMNYSNTITYATSMMDKTVTVAEVDEFGMYTGVDTTGVVTGVLLGSDPILFIDGEPYALSQIMSVGETKEDVEVDTEDTETEETPEVDTETETETP